MHLYLFCSHLQTFKFQSMFFLILFLLLVVLIISYHSERIKQECILYRDKYSNCLYTHYELKTTISFQGFILDTNKSFYCLLSFPLTSLRSVFWNTHFIGTSLHHLCRILVKLSLRTSKHLWIFQQFPFKAVKNYPHKTKDTFENTDSFSVYKCKPALKLLTVLNTFLWGSKLTSPMPHLLVRGTCG